MNILTGLYFGEKQAVVTIFYTSFPYTMDREIIVREPDGGEPKCEMFCKSYSKKWTLHKTGLTIKFDRDTGRFFDSPKSMLKLHLHPEKEIKQVRKLAELSDFLGYSSLKVLEYFSSMNSKINLLDLKQTG